jgi:hypothetical protein
MNCGSRQTKILTHAQRNGYGRHVTRFRPSTWCIERSHIDNQGHRVKKPGVLTPGASQ